MKTLTLTPHTIVVCVVDDAHAWLVGQTLPDPMIRMVLSHEYLGNPDPWVGLIQCLKTNAPEPIELVLERPTVAQLEHVIHVAHKHHYQLHVMCFKSTNRSWTTYVDSLTRDLHPTLTRLSGHRQLKYNIDQVALNLIQRCTRTVTDVPWVVFTDLHESVEGLKQLYQLASAKHPEGFHLIINGDYLDKGHDTIQMVNELYNLRLLQHFQHRELVLVIGNHENYVYKALKGALTSRPDNEPEVFTSLATFRRNYVPRKLFYMLFESSLPFVKLTRAQAPTVYVSHALCKERYLGKVSARALRKQRNLRANGQPFDYELFDKEDFTDAYYHVVGHSTVPVAQVRDQRVLLDTHGGLTGLHTGVSITQASTFEPEDFFTVQV